VGRNEAVREPVGVRDEVFVGHLVKVPVHDGVEEPVTVIFMLEVRVQVRVVVALGKVPL